MATEKVFTPKQAAVAVLEKVSKLLKLSELAKSEKQSKLDLNKEFENLNSLLKGEKTENSKKENAIPSEHNSKEAFQNEGKGPKGEIHPKEHAEGAPTNTTQETPPPGENTHEQAEGNNEPAGTTPKDGIEQNNDLKGHLKLAKFIGRMEAKRVSKTTQATAR